MTFLNKVTNPKSVVGAPIDANPYKATGTTPYAGAGTQTPYKATGKNENKNK